MKKTVTLLGVLLLGLTGHSLWAQDKFPIRPVTLVVPQTAGGANDAIARVLAQKLGEQTGQSFVVENRPGAGGNVGTASTAKAKPDGYTLLVTADSSQVINPALYAKTGFDPIKDFEPVARSPRPGMCWWPIPRSLPTRWLNSSAWPKRNLANTPSPRRATAR